MRMELEAHLRHDDTVSQGLARRRTTRSTTVKAALWSVRDEQKSNQAKEDLNAMWDTSTIFTTSIKVQSTKYL